MHLIILHILHRYNVKFNLRIRATLYQQYIIQTNNKCTYVYL